MSFLERALRHVREPRSQLPVVSKSRDQAEVDAHNAALKDYYAQQENARYKRDPWFLEIEQRTEDDRNDFLHSRGLKPEPTRIPKEFRRQARALVAAKRRRKG